MRLVPLLALAAGLAGPAAPAADPDTKVYQWRTYTAAPGKFDALNARMKDHALAAVGRHGITPVGVFVPAGENKDGKIHLLVAAKDKAALEKGLAELKTDEAWAKAVAESEKGGKIVDKLDTRLLAVTDYSPVFKVEKGKDGRVFELRTYTATKGNLGHLNDRFRNHTIKLFEKHGMTNVVYWNVPKGEAGDDVMLVYLLAHKSPEAAKKSFDAFRLDPDWAAARKASEEKGGGSLTEKGGVLSEFLKPADYSPLK
ncbi:MAG: NIPSNAP family protein [Isosphaera sp.]|nr:NIPSNAP family protein [Isosphaera sp.]